MKNIQNIITITLLAITFYVPFAFAETQTSTQESFQTQTEAAKKYLSDTAITAKVKTAFITNKDIRSLNISVTTQEGIVTLTGTVTDEAQKQVADKIAKETTGVKKVQNDIIVKKE